MVTGGAAQSEAAWLPFSSPSLSWELPWKGCKSFVGYVLALITYIMEVLAPAGRRRRPPRGRGPLGRGPWSSRVCRWPSGALEGTREATVLYDFFVWHCSPVA